ncbi:MAG: 3-deoxy-manno-octulosonate cytidylyltransferase [Alphaproteobacteria bacterium]
MKTAIIIPARYGSTRFPGKPLALIGGRSMLSRVVDIARSAARNFEGVSVYVTTDDERIAAHAAKIGADCLMTPPECPSGSDRCLAAAKQLPQMPDFTLNLQGDAPFTPPAALHALLEKFQADPSLEVVTPVHALRWEALDTLRESKKTTPFSGTCAVLGQDNRAIWFSKNILPAIRKESQMRGESAFSPVYQHIGLYGFSSAALEKFCALPQSHYEQLEGLEQLRLIENGIKITCVPIEIKDGAMPSGIDTPEDLARAEALLSEPHS